MAKTIELTGNGLSAWAPDTGDWQVFASLDMDATGKKLVPTEVILNGPNGRTRNLISKAEFGDVKAHIEFMIPNGSNSGVYFMGRYEIQIYDSYGVEKAAYPGIECGGIYQRWDNNRDPRGFEGHSPRVNAAKPGGQWQSFDVIFRAPRFDSSGNKLTNARFERVRHNGVVVHEDIELTGPTRAAAFNDEKPKGPLMLQGDHGPVAYRNIRIEPAGPLPFFTFDNGMKDAAHPTIESQVEMVAELGYTGIAARIGKDLAETVRFMDEHGLQAFPAYAGVNIDAEKPYGRHLTDAMDILAGRNATLWVFIQSKKYRPSDQAADSRAVEVITKIAEMAAKKKVRVALYPHTGFWLEKVEDSVRLVRKVDMPNVGATFNLCHFLKTDNQKNLRSVLQEAMPHLFVVSINGADSGGNDWKTLIQPLGDGTFDMQAFMQTLLELGYNGPVGLQCYGIGGDAEQNLSRSIKAWRNIWQNIKQTD